MDRIIKRGDIYYANLNPVIGSEQGGTRPVLIISNDTGNKHSPTVIVAAITGQIGTKKKLRHTLSYTMSMDLIKIPLSCWSKFVPLINNACKSI